MVLRLTTPLIAAAPARGPLRASPANPRYFTDGSGQAIYLTGAHPWNNLVDMGRHDPPEKFDFDASLDRTIIQPSEGAKEVVTALAFLTSVSAVGLLPNISQQGVGAKVGEARVVDFAVRFDDLDVLSEM